MSTSPVIPPISVAQAKAAPGQLRAKIAAYLAVSPQAEFTVTGIANTLGHSCRAVGNVLESVARAGHADQTLVSPRTFRANARTAAASSGAPNPRPVPAPRPRPAAPPLVPKPRTAPATTDPAPERNSR